MLGSALIAFIVVVMAGLSTGLGGLLACFIENSKPSYFSILLGLSAGVMIYISFVELLAVFDRKIGIRLFKYNLHSRYGGYIFSR